MRRLLTALLATLLLLSATPSAFGAQTERIEAVYRSTEACLTGLGTPTAGGLGGEWMVLGLARSGKNIDEAYYESAVAYVQGHMDDNGRLHPSKSTVNCRFVVALTAIGGLYGILGGIAILAIHITGLKSLGRPYLGIPEGKFLRERLVNRKWRDRKLKPEDERNQK